VRPNGAPVLVTSSGAAHTYDASLGSFTQLSTSWWAGGSEAWTARTRTNTLGPLATLESELAAAAPPAEVGTARPSWWSTALTLGHLESRMHAARAIDSASEYKQALLVYAQRIANEGFRAKAEELVRELFGPVYWLLSS
jgi:protein HIRA/HIR1